MTDQENEIRTIFKDTRTIAVVGASSNSFRASHGVMAFLQRQGYRTIPVNPQESGEILGEKVYASLRDIPEPVDMVDCFRRSEFITPLAEDAVAIGAKVLWMQLGIVSEEAAAIARKGGLKVVMNRCPAIDIPGLGIPPK